MKIYKPEEYLKKVDPILGLAINKNLTKLKSRGSVYEGLLRAIISQQISVAAANSVREKFLKNFGGKFPEPKILANLKDEDLQGCGLSRQKIGYVKNVAEHFLRRTTEVPPLLKGGGHERKLVPGDFLKMSDQEIIDDLTKIKGVGTWTAEMLLIFNLNKPDVFSIKDLGLLNAIYKLYKINAKKYKKKNLEKKVLKISESWSPYRSLACRYLWNYKDDK